MTWASNKAALELQNFHLAANRISKIHRISEVVIEGARRVYVRVYARVEVSWKLREGAVATRLAG